MGDDPFPAHPTAARPHDRPETAALADRAAGRHPGVEYGLVTRVGDEVEHLGGRSGDQDVARTSAITASGAGPPDSSSRSDHFFAVECFDFLWGEPKLGENRLGVFARPGAGRAHRPVVFGYRDRVPQNGDGPEFERLDWRRQL